MFSIILSPEGCVRQVPAPVLWLFILELLREDPPMCQFCYEQHNSTYMKISS
jgi:hypothetical protein